MSTCSGQTKRESPHAPLLRTLPRQSGATLLVPRPYTPTWPSPCLIRYATLRILRAASSPILSLDWSADCELITAASARCELSHWEARRGRKLMPNHDADAAEIAAASWASITSPLAWEAQVRLAALSRTARRGQSAARLLPEQWVGSGVAPTAVRQCHSRLRSLAPLPHPQLRRLSPGPVCTALSSCAGRAAQAFRWLRRLVGASVTGWDAACNFGRL